MNDHKSKLKIDRDFENLAPFFAQKLRSAIGECQADGYPVALFEGMRSETRQNQLWAQGRAADGKIITYARGGQSWHNYGLAADLVGFINGRWDWQLNYDKIEQIMVSHGFSSLKFERAHFQITGGMAIDNAKRIAKDQGLLALWSIIENQIKK